MSEPVRRCSLGAGAWSGATIQCPIDFLAPLVLAVPGKARELLETLSWWGVNRFSIDWEAESMRQVFERLSRWGYEVNFYNVPDLKAFLQATLLLPRSLTADFNFPRWHYFGRGSGRRSHYHQYSLVS